MTSCPNPLVNGSVVDAFVIMEEGWTSLDYLVREVGDDVVGEIQFYHYYPPTRQDESKRQIPQLHHLVSDLGGIREEFLHRRTICLLVDDAVFTGRTLKTAAHYVRALGYHEKNIYVYARDIRCTDLEWKDGSLMRDPHLQHILVYQELLGVVA